MGSDLKANGPINIAVSVAGTAPIERVDIFRDLDLIHTFPETIQREQNKIRVSWSGQRIRARNRLVRWDGGLTLDKGKILNAEGYAFDSASEGIQETTDRSVTWKSVTTGDADGVILTLDAPPETVLHFQTGVVDHQVSLKEISNGPVRVDAGGIEIAAVFEQMPIGAGREVEFSFKENTPPSGCHPYWVRVTQIDGAKAWASPIYVTA